jgi:hypothetical protein
MRSDVVPALERRPTQKFLPLLRSEISRLTHRRLFRALVVLLVAGIALISSIVFFAHHAATVRQSPDQRYLAYQAIPIVIMATSIATAGLAFIIGASSGGAEWSSRSMTLQLLFEPRRLRLLCVKWLGLVVTTAAVAGTALALSVGFAAFTASARGTWDDRYALLDTMRDSFGQQMLQMAGRGILLVVISATAGYAIAMLVRNTGASLGVAFVYFVVVENGVRIALSKYGTEPFMLSTNALASVFPGGFEVPGRSAGEFAEQPVVHLDNLRATATMFGYSLVLAMGAAWSFTRRDVS